MVVVGGPDRKEARASVPDAVHPIGTGERINGFIIEGWEPGIVQQLTDGSIIKLASGGMLDSLEMTTTRLTGGIIR